MTHVFAQPNAGREPGPAPAAAQLLLLMAADRAAALAQEIALRSGLVVPRPVPAEWMVQAVEAMKADVTRFRAILDESGWP